MLDEDDGIDTDGFVEFADTDEDDFVGMFYLNGSFKGGGRGEERVWSVTF